MYHHKYFNNTGNYYIEHICVTNKMTFIRHQQQIGSKFAAEIIKIYVFRNSYDDF